MDERTLFLRPPVWLPIAVALIAGGMYVMGKYVEKQDFSPVMITVSGDGHVFAVPDIAELSFGVQTQSKREAKDAMEILSERMKAIFTAVKKEGIPEKDIQTEQFSLHPVYDWTERGGRGLKGYEAYESLRVKVRDLDMVDDVLSAATNAGANQAGSVQFTMDDPDVLKSVAREEAIKEAQEKAKVLAKDLGLRLGKLKGFNEGGGGYIAMTMRAMDGVGGGIEESASPPLPAGEQKVTVSVTLTYEVK